MTQIYLTMPQPGETITEGSIVAWMLPVGSHVKEGQAVVELETEKALFEYESPFEGDIVKILADPNSKVPVGAPIAILEVTEDKARAYSSLGLAQKVEFEKSEVAVSKIPENKTVIVETTKRLPEQVFPSPYIRHLLLENNLSHDVIASIKGSGPHGRVTKEDVENYISSDPPLQREGAVATYKDAPLSPIRARIAKHMQESKQTIPHAHTGVDVDLTQLLSMRNSMKDDFLNAKGFPLRLMPILFVAVKKACEIVPVVNSTIMEKENVIRFHENINLGMAMGTKNGLMTPVVKACQSLTFMEFARNYEDLLLRSEQNKLKPTDFEGSTFTFNNFGTFGLDFGVQVIPPGQTAVLGMGATHQKPWVVNQEVMIRSIASFFLAFDHRTMDGREAGEFLSVLKNELESLSVVKLIE